MKFIALLPFLAITTAIATPAVATNPISAESIAADLRKAADWQLAHPSGIEITDWVIAPLYDGLRHAALATGEANYLAAVIELGQQASWQGRWKPYFADDYAVNHSWLEIYRLDPSRTERLLPTQARLDQIVAEPVLDVLRHTDIPRIHRDRVTSRWTWADALYMGPPTLSVMYQITSDTKYLDTMDREYRFAYEQLYDSEAKLFYRDTRYFTQRTPSGERVFWSRGNGWVYAGLTYVLDALPADYPSRPFYEKLFLEMSASVLACQQPDGIWRPSMHDPDQIPIGEASGSGFFTYGLAWGINRGLLDRSTHEPAVQRAWQALQACLLPDGRVGYVQPIGSSPDPLSSHSIQDYGTGAFLLAGSEVLRMLGAPQPVPTAEVYARAEALIAERATQPRAYARVVPERKDDLAWENDKVAFRIYGPALRDSIENSGIDLWFKRVPRPIINHWYDLEHTQNISYHVDHGEGYDAYKVGDSRGCGAPALWVDDIPVMSNVYETSDIFWTSPEELAFRVSYRYAPHFTTDADGHPIWEQRTVRLRMGERLNHITVRYAHTPRDNGGVITEFAHQSAVGLFAQSPEATLIRDTERGIYGWHDHVDGQDLFTAVMVDPAIVAGALRRSHFGEPTGSLHLWIKVKLDAKSTYHYRTGFAWAGDGEITTLEQWINYLRQVQEAE